MPNKNYSTHPKTKIRTCCMQECRDFYIVIKLLDNSEENPACTFEPHNSGKYLTFKELRERGQKCEYNFPINESKPAKKSQEKPTEKASSYSGRLGRIKDAFSGDDMGPASPPDVSEVLDELGVSRRERAGESLGDTFSISLGR